MGSETTHLNEWGERENSKKASMKVRSKLSWIPRLDKKNTSQL